MKNPLHPQNEIESDCYAIRSKQPDANIDCISPSGYKIDIIKMLLSKTSEIHGNKANAGRAYLAGCLAGLQGTTAIEIEKNFKTLIS